MRSSEVVVCAIAGGSGAGKTTLAMKLLNRLGDQGSHFTIDWYYRDLSHLTPAERSLVNFDHPDSLEVELFAEHLQQLAAGRDIAAPIYDFSTHTRSTEVRHVPARPCIVIEGIHLLGLEPVRRTCNVLVFIDVAADIRLARRVRRDVAERGRTQESVHEQWHATVAPMHEQFVQPSAAFAHVTIGVDDDLDEAADALAANLRQRIDA